MITPECKFGYPETQLREIWTEDKFKDFMKWMRGQTFSVCDGTLFDGELNRMVGSGCGPHGYVFYAHDVTNFVTGGPILD